MIRLKKINNFEYFAPSTLSEAVSLLAQYKERAKVFSGGTDLLVQMKQRKLTPEYVIDLKNISELNNIDYILYYELLDTVVHADVGVGLTNLDGTVKNLNAGALSQYDLDEYSPLLYATAGVKLPFTGMSAKAEAVYSHGSDTKKTDVQAELQYDFIDNLAVDLGAKLGYRIMKIDAEQNNVPDLQLEFKGPYIGLDIHF